MEANSQFSSPPQLTSQYYNPDDEYVRMYQATTSNSKPPALPPKPSTSPYGDQFASKRNSRASFSGDSWNNVPITPTKYADTTNLQWDNNTMPPTHTQQWDNTPPTNTQQWNNTTSSTHTQQWSNTATPTNAQWNNSVTTPHSAQWNSTPIMANQSLEAQQTRRENMMLQNEIERLRQQLQQQQQQSINANANDAWMTQQNQQLHQQVAQLTQENDDLRRKLSAMESELMVLQHSLKTHEEDFAQERKDRVRIHEEKEKLQEQLESQEQVIKMLTEEHGGKLMEMENNMGLGEERQHCQRCNRLLYPNELFEHMQKCIQ